MDDEEMAVSLPGVLWVVHKHQGRAFAYFLQVKYIKYKRAQYVTKSEICVEASTWCFRGEFASIFRFRQLAIV